MQSQFDFKMAVGLMDCTMVLIILVLTALGGRVALHLLRPHPRSSPSTHAARIALLALLLSGEATLLLHLLSVVTGRVSLLLEFLLVRVMGLFCPLLFVNACIAYCQSRRQTMRQLESESGTRLTSPCRFTAKGKEANLCGDEPSAVHHPPYSSEGGNGEGTTSKSVLTSQELPLCSIGSRSNEKGTTSQFGRQTRVHFLPSPDKETHHSYRSQSILPMENDFSKRKVGFSAVHVRRRGGCVAGMMSFLRGYLWVFAIGVSFVSGMHPDVYPCLFAKCAPFDLSPTTRNNGAGNEKLFVSNDQLKSLQLADDNQYFPAETNLESTDDVTSNMVEGRNASGVVEMKTSKPITTGEIEKAIAEHLPAFGLCLFYLLLLLYLALGILGSPRLTLRDVERDVVLDDRTTTGRGIHVGKKLTLHVVPKVHVPVGITGVVYSDFETDSVLHAQDMPNERLHNQCSGLKSGQSAVSDTSSELYVSACVFLQETAPNVEVDSNVQPSQQSAEETTVFRPEHFHLSSQDADAPSATHFESRGLDRVTRVAEKTLKSANHIHPRGFNLSPQQQSSLRARTSTRSSVRQATEDTAGDDGDCYACQQMAPYVVMAAIVLLVQHVLLLPLWSAAVWAKYGQMQVTSPASVFLPTYCAVCFVFWRILKEAGR